MLALFLIVTLVGSVAFYRHEQYTRYHFDKTRSDPDALFAGEEEAEQSSLQAIIGNGGEGDRAAQSAEEEDYANRAYPASEIPLSATLNAQQAFKNAKARKAPKNSPGSWTLTGPSTARVPATLSFYGGQNKEYVAAGRITALAIDPACSNTKCTLWAAAAGGGIWRTNNALSGSGASWSFVSGSFATNAIGTLTYDAAHKTLYAGTGEANASSDSEAGLGIYKSTDGGSSWSKLASQVTSLTSSSCGASGSNGACTALVSNGTYTGDAFAGRSISSILVDPTNPSVLYVGSTRSVRGISSVSNGVSSNPTPPRPPFGLFKSTDGGASFTYVWDGNVSVRGVNHAELDPNNPAIVYAAAFQQGIWRSLDGGTTWAQIKTPLTASLNTDRAEFAAAKLPNGKTRMYAGIGSSSGLARFYRTDDASGAATFADMTNAGSMNYCTAQCWYDNYVVSPAGSPDTVFLGGSHQYGEIYGISNGRGVVMSTDGGTTFTDMTVEYGDGTTSINLHPDHHALTVVPGNPNIFFSGSDGGLVRSNGKFVDNSAVCASRGLTGADLATCQQLLSKIPERLFSLNKGFSTLQFQSVLANPQNSSLLIGGTQDNGTWLSNGSVQNWSQTIYGDGGQSGFDVANPAFRFNTFYTQAVDANFQNGDPTKWVVISGPLFNSGETAPFYMAIIGDPKVGGTMFAGMQSVWRTTDNGGNQAYLEANCSEFTTSAAAPDCGDWQRLGSGLLTASGLGDRAGGAVAAVERTPSDTNTLWSATSTGRVFISKNADAATAGSVAFTRLDSLATNDPGRFVSSIFVDPANSNHAWISYSGYNYTTPSQPGHVFSVTYDPTAGTATWVNLDAGSGPMGDLPVTDLVQDSATGDLYAATDFGVLRLANGSTSWTAAGSGLPMVEVAGLTIVPGSRVLYAATHGRSAWQLKLP